MKTCRLYQGCRGAAVFNVIHKMVGQRFPQNIPACHACASKVGSKSEGGAVINRPDRENTFYKIVNLQEVTTTENQQ